MKQILLAYVVVSIVLIALLSVLSYGYGSGYVYVYWREWQLQTNIWLLLFFFLSISVSLQILWLLLKRYFSREQRKVETVFNFKNLHPYEQFAVIWLLDAAEDQHQFIRQVFAQSGLLKGVMEARMYSIQQQYPQALAALNQSSAMAFELAEIQRIEIYLAQQQPEQALTHLEFLNQHELSPWLFKVKTAYQKRLIALWGEFATQYPWHYLRSTKYGHLDADTKQKWLTELLTQFEQADAENLQALQQRYSDLSEQIFSQSYAIQVLWLKLLSRLPDLAAQHERLAVQMLSEQFNQEVFYLWFQQQLLKQQPDYAKIEKQINLWEQKYPALPVFSFAKWHIFTATARYSEAEQLLDLYPEHVLMSYLRVKSNLKDQPELLKQLNLIFENNSNFVEIKI